MTDMDAAIAEVGMILDKTDQPEPRPGERFHETLCRTWLELRRRLAKAEQERDDWKGESEAAVDAANELRPTLERAEAAEEALSRCDQAGMRLIHGLAALTERIQAAEDNAAMWHRIADERSAALLEASAAKETAGATNCCPLCESNVRRAELAEQMYRRDGAAWHDQELEGQAAAMREALESVQWSRFCPGGTIGGPLHGCPKCGGFSDGTHDDDCPIGKALAPDAGKAVLARLARAEAVEKWARRCEKDCPVLRQAQGNVANIVNLHNALLLADDERAALDAQADEGPRRRQPMTDNASTVTAPCPCEPADAGTTLLAEHERLQALVEAVRAWQRSPVFDTASVRAALVGLP